MLKFRDRPISQKVTIITMVITAAALLLAGLGIVVADSVLFRQSLRRDLSALGRIVADNSTAALDFQRSGFRGSNLKRLARPFARGRRLHLLEQWRAASQILAPTRFCLPAA